MRNGPRTTSRKGSNHQDLGDPQRGNASEVRKDGPEANERESDEEGRIGPGDCQDAEPGKRCSHRPVAFRREGDGYEHDCKWKEDGDPAGRRPKVPGSIDQPAPLTPTIA